MVYKARLKRLENKLPKAREGRFDYSVLTMEELKFFQRVLLEDNPTEAEEERFAEIEAKIPWR